MRLLPPTLVVCGSILAGWGLNDLPNFFGNTARTALILVILLAYACGVLLRISFDPFRKGQSKGKRWPIVLGVATVPFVFAAASRFDRRGIFVLPDILAIRWFGVVLLLIGDAIRIAALRELGRQYSAFLTIQTGHQLIRTGPYRWVRHPFYLGGLLNVPGMMLVLRSPLAVIVFVISILFVHNRIGREERMLIEQFPENYPAYQRHSWRLLPYIY